MVCCVDRKYVVVCRYLCNHVTVTHIFWHKRLFEKVTVTDTGTLLVLVLGQRPRTYLVI